MADLEPASALASLPTAKEFADELARQCYHFSELSWFDYTKAEQLIEAREAIATVVMRNQSDRIASLEAQLASAREEALREAFAALRAEADSCVAAAREAAQRGDQVDRVDYLAAAATVRACAAVVEALLTSPPKSPWIPLTERRPEHGDGVLLLGVYASGEDFFYHPCSWPPVELYDAADDVTHWMPIPPRPDAQKEPL